MDFYTQIGDEEVTFTQFHDMVEYIKQHLAQWSSFDSSKPQIIMVSKVPSETPTLGISVDDGVKAIDVFGGLPENWSQQQKDLYLKLTKMAETEGEEAVRDYLRNQGK